MAKTKVAIIIPSWNSAKDLPKLLRSLKDQKLTTAEQTVILSDNGSADDTVDVSKKLYPGIIVVENGRNLGLAGGNNVGIERALRMGMEAVIVLNADTIVDPGLVENLVKAHRKYPDSLLSPKIYFAPGREFHHDRYKATDRGNVIWYAGGIMDWDNVLGSNRGVDEIDKGQFDQPIETDFATGCCMLIPATLARKTKGFDPKLYLYYEDNDLSMRAKKVGGQIWYVPTAKMWHVNAGSSGVGSELHDYFTTRNRLVLGFRWTPVRTKFALIREGLRFLVSGRPGQKRGATDFFLGRFGKGSYQV